MAKNRSRRLRKKLYVDEFAVYGFEFFCRLNIEDASEHDSLLDEFIEFIESHGLVMGGGANAKEFEGFVVSEGRYDSPSEKDRKAIDSWLNSHPKCYEVKVGSLVDAMYSM